MLASIEASKLVGAETGTLRLTVAEAKELTDPETAVAEKVCAP